MVDPLIAPDPTAVVPAGTTDQAEHDPGDVARVSEWVGKIDRAEEHWKKPFAQMKTNRDIAAKGANKKWVEDGCFRVPILNRHINQAVAVLYARNPRSQVQRRKQLMYQLWDGREDTLVSSMQLAQAGDTDAVALLQEVAAVLRQDLMLDRMAKTTEILWDYYLNEQSVNYKKQLKAAVRRTKVNGVAYVKLVFQRALKPNPETQAKIDDTTAKLKEVERLLLAQEGGKLEETSAEASTLKSMLADLKQQEYIVVREGPALDFPKSDEVLIDPEVTHLASLSGAGWIAFPYDKTKEEIQKLWNVDLTDNLEDYVGARSDTRKPPISARAGKEEGQSKKIRVYEVWDKETQQKFVICRYYKGFLEMPAAPKPQLSRFWPLFPLVMNEVEHDDIIIPPSDVEQAADIQAEYNRAREGLRQHRVAARPYYVESGALSPEDKAKLANHLDHEVLTIPALAANQDVAKLIQRGPTAPIDPNLYEAEIHFKDLQRTVGTQEAALGGPTGKATATGDSIAENSRSTQNEDNIDDLDEMLTELSMAAGEMMLMELSKPTVIEIVGPGAVWPDHPQSRAEASKHLQLKIEAGSSGRPNQAAELAKLERSVPMLVQLGGLNPKPLVKRYGELLDLTVDDFVAEGMPSVVAINAAMSKTAAGAQAQTTGDPASNPADQGAAGGQNAPVADQRPPPGQPAFPTPQI